MSKKERIQEALGFGNRQSQGNKGKAKNGSVYQNAGDVIIGISEDHLEEWFSELKAQIAKDDAAMLVDIETTIDDALVNKVASIIADVYKDHCQNEPYDEKLTITLADLKAKQDDIVGDISAVLKDTGEIKVKISKLQNLINECQSKIDDIYAICQKNLEYCQHLLNFVKGFGVEFKDCKTFLSKIYERNEQQYYILKRIEDASKKTDETLKQHGAILSVILNCINEILEANSTCFQSGFTDEVKRIFNDYSSHFDSKLAKAVVDINDNTNKAVGAAEANINDKIAKVGNATAEGISALRKLLEEIQTQLAEMNQGNNQHDKGNEPPQHKSLPTKKIDYCPYCGIYVGVPENKKYIDERGNCTTCGQNIYSTSNINEFIKEHTVKFYVNDRYREEGMYKVFQMPKACQNDSLPIIYIPKKTCSGQIIRFLDTIQVARGYEENARRIKIIVVPNTVRSIGANNNSTFSAFGDKILVICLGNPHIGAVVREKTDIRLRNNL